MSQTPESHAIPPSVELPAPSEPVSLAPMVDPDLRVPAVGDSRWDLPTKRTVVVILLIAAVGLLWISRSVLPILVIAAIISYILSPLVDLLERVRVPRAVSTIVLFVLLLFLIVLTPILLAPVLVNQLVSLNFDVQATAVRFFAWLGRTVYNLPETVEVLGFQIPLTGVTEQIETGLSEFRFIPTIAEILNYIQQLISTATNLVSSTAAISISVVGGLVQAVITFLVLFFVSLYLTKDAPSIRAYVEGLVPQSYHSEWVDLLRRIGHIWQSFLRGQILLSLVIFLVTWGVLTAIGMPGALLLAIVAGMLEIIPNLGPTIATIPAVIIALIQGSDTLAVYGINNFGFALITVAAYFIINQLENSILVPRIIGGFVNLHPIVVICGVMVGFQTAGILGALFAAPVLASMRVLGAYIHAKLLDYKPFLGHELPERRRRPAEYRRTVTGEELAAQPRPAVAQRNAAPTPPGEADEEETPQSRERQMEAESSSVQEKSSPASPPHSFPAEST